MAPKFLFNSLSLIVFSNVKCSVLVLSTVRIYLIYIGTFKPDFSWYYNPQLVVESSEVGRTLIALCIPRLKPLVEKWVSRIAALLRIGVLTKRNVSITIPSQNCDINSNRLPKNGEEVFELPKSVANYSTFCISTEHLSGDQC